MRREKTSRLIRMLFCDFCGLKRQECRVLIEGRDFVHICDQCVVVCAEMIAREIQKHAPKEPELPLPPTEPTEPA
jgi:ATP-dependent protease Clp ATPase subunit